MIPKGACRVNSIKKVRNIRTNLVNIANSRRRAGESCTKCKKYEVKLRKGEVQKDKVHERLSGRNKKVKLRKRKMQKGEVQEKVKCKKREVQER